MGRLYIETIDTRGYRFMQVRFHVDDDGRLVSPPVAMLTDPIKPSLAGRAWLRPVKRRRGK